MSGVPQITISESAESLKSLMKQPGSGLRYAKIQALYLLKIKAVENVNHLAIILGRGESTIHHWLSLYKRGGLSKLLEEPPKTGRPKKLDVETVSQLQKELSEPEGFENYQEIQKWLFICEGIEVSYATVYRTARYELQSKLKVPRPYHEKQQPGIIEVFKHHFPQRISGLIADIQAKYGNKRRINFWFQDETRLGLRTHSGQKITRKGVKPKQPWQWHYQYYYIYGLVAPVTGQSFFYEFSHFNSQCLSIFLNKFAQEWTEEIHIIQLDNAPCHRTDKLIVPDNVVLFFQPPYCPELNGIERVWQYVKRLIKNFWFIDLEEVKQKVGCLLNNLSQDIVRSLTGWQYILDALSL
jgi:transposase